MGRQSTSPVLAYWAGAQHARSYHLVARNGGGLGWGSGSPGLVLPQLLNATPAQICPWRDGSNDLGGGLADGCCRATMSGCGGKEGRSIWLLPRTEAPVGNPDGLRGRREPEVSISPEEQLTRCGAGC